MGKSNAILFTFRTIAWTIIQAPRYTLYPCSCEFSLQGMSLLSLSQKKSLMIS